MKIKRRVFETTYNKQKLVTIPKYCDIEAGDLVLVERCDETRKKEKK